jgi:hypothetical protein
MEFLGFVKPFQAFSIPPGSSQLRALKTTREKSQKKLKPTLRLCLVLRRTLPTRARKIFDESNPSADRTLTRRAGGAGVRSGRRGNPGAQLGGVCGAWFHPSFRPRSSLQKSRQTKTSAGVCRDRLQLLQLRANSRRSDATS